MYGVNFYCPSCHSYSASDENNICSGDTLVCEHCGEETTAILLSKNEEESRFQKITALRTENEQLKAEIDTYKKLERERWENAKRVFGDKVQKGDNNG